MFSELSTKRCSFYSYGLGFVNNKATNKIFSLYSASESTAVVISSGYIMIFIIHSKYFPDSDWLKAHT